VKVLAVQHPFMWAAFWATFSLTYLVTLMNLPYYLKRTKKTTAILEPTSQINTKEVFKAQ
jgi:hypothetical protein